MDGIVIFLNQDISVGGTFMNIEKIMKIARERVFKNFIMSFCEFGALQVIDWHNADNTREYHIRFIFDNEGKTMSVSGDVGRCHVRISKL